MREHNPRIWLNLKSSDNEDLDENEEDEKLDETDSFDEI